MWQRHVVATCGRGRSAAAAPLLCLCSLAAVAGQTPCPANSAGEGDGTPCICDEGYDGSIEYNDAETPPVYEGTCSPVDANHFLGMGTGLRMSVILLAVSILAFNVASKTSFQCSMTTGLGLLLFWLLCTVFVLTAPREGDADLAETVEIDVVWWPRFVLSILLYAGTAVAVLAYIKDGVFFTADRKTRVIIP